jgi:hypothetical protein
MNAVVQEQPRRARDPDRDLRQMVASLLPPASGHPFSELLADFERMARDEGIAPSRYVGQAAGLVRRMLRELESHGLAVRQTHTANGKVLLDPLWGGPQFAPPRFDIITRRRQRRAEPPRSRSTECPPVNVVHEAPPVERPAPSLAALRNEIAQVSAKVRELAAQLQRMEAQCDAMQTAR